MPHPSLGRTVYWIGEPARGARWDLEAGTNRLGRSTLRTPRGPPALLPSPRRARVASGRQVEASAALELPPSRGTLPSTSLLARLATPVRRGDAPASMPQHAPGASLLIRTRLRTAQLRVGELGSQGRQGASKTERLTQGDLSTCSISRGACLAGRGSARRADRC